jgi:shikimate 5-dehydrogenase
MHRRMYSYSSIWSDPEALLQSAQELGSKVVDGFWGIVNQSQQWIHKSEDSNPIVDVQVIIVIKAHVLLEGGRSRIT